MTELVRIAGRLKLPPDTELRKAAAETGVADPPSETEYDHQPRRYFDTSVEKNIIQISPEYISPGCSASRNGMAVADMKTSRKDFRGP